MKDKRGWLRIFEASLAIVMLTGVVLYVYTAQKAAADESEFFYNMEDKLLKDFAENAVLRHSIFSGDNITLIEYANKTIGSAYGFQIRICSLNEPCGLSVLTNAAVYSEDRIFASNVTDYKPTKVRVFIWEK
jgi:hypothetical protein